MLVYSNNVGLLLKSVVLFLCYNRFYRILVKVLFGEIISLKIINGNNSCM